MTDQLLRKRLIRLAYENPELRPDLIPILTAGQQEEEEKDAKFEKGKDVPLKDMPKKLQENAKNPPPEAKALKEKMKSAAAKLTKDQIAEIKDEMVSSGVPVRFMSGGGSLNIVTGETTARGANVMHQIVYWNFSKETAKKIAKWLGVRPEFSKAASEKEAGCEKLPEGPMRDNCEKKKEEGSKSEDKDEKKASDDKTAGCEKLPEGPMRDNCEKKKEEGAKSDDKKDDKKASIRTASDNMDLELFPKSPLPETASQVAPKFGGFSWD
jgi:hypothetical protein